LDKHSIKLNIFGRQIPVVVDSENEAAAVLQAAKLINEKVRQFRVDYGIRDDVDILIMCGLEIATQFIKVQTLLDDNADTEKLMDKLSKLEEKLSISQYIED
jgi:cell division protein ZapA